MEAAQGAAHEAPAHAQTADAQPEPVANIFAMRDTPPATPPRPSQAVTPVDTDLPDLAPPAARKSMLDTGGSAGTDAESNATMGAAPGTEADRQVFEGLSEVITNVINVDTSHGAAVVPVPSAANTGNLRALSHERRRPTHQFAPTGLEHYIAKTTYTTNYAYILIYILSVLATAVYVITRVSYISRGVQRSALPVNALVRTANGTMVAFKALLEEQDSDAVWGDGTRIPEEFLDLPDFWQVKDFVNANSYSYWWSTCVLAAEIGGFILVHISQQMFFRQDTKFFTMPPETVQRLREVCKKKGKLQKINVMVCTYNEPMETVKACVQHLLDADMPVYAQKKIYVGDDGAKKKFPVSEDKRRMVEEFHRQGHKNVIWVGDRKSLPHQLNGKSSNINHMVLNHMYPKVRRTRDVPYRDILLVMDCDHLVEPEFFAKACAVMLNREVAVCLIPQAFWNEVHPDCFDNSNYNFMFRLMPYYFGAGCCFVTGTNVMIRARAAFEACRFDENPHQHETTSLIPELQEEMSATLNGTGLNTHRQLFSETLLAEDIDLGSRVHTLGYKSVFLSEVLAKGEVPRGPRAIWKQRFRWASAAHMYILDPDSVFWRYQPHMSFWQKSLYWIPLILHCIIVWSEPIMFLMPILCLGFDLCPYGVDIVLWTTHFVKLATSFAVSTYAETFELQRAAVYGQTMARVLFFVNVKAVLNTLMVYTGWKKPGAFKVTKKGTADGAAGLGAAGATGALTAGLPANSIALPGAPTAHPKRGAGNSGPQVPRFMKGMRLYRVHDTLSSVTETRKRCLPFDGTLDFWVLVLITGLNLWAVIWGLVRLEGRNAIFSLQGCESQNVQMIALVFGFIEAIPGLLFLMYCLVQERAEWVMKIWVPAVIFSVSAACIVIEARVGLQYIGGVVGADWAMPPPGLCEPETTDIV